MRRALMAGTGAALALGVINALALLSNYATAPRPIFTLLSVEQLGREPVLVLRREVEADTVADWRVVIWPAGDGIGAPVCDGAGTGAYDLTEPKRVPMSVDYFTGDPGCWGRLEAGAAYRGAVTYTAAKGEPMIARFVLHR